MNNEMPRGGCSRAPLYPIVRKQAQETRSQEGVGSVLIDKSKLGSTGSLLCMWYL